LKYDWHIKKAAKLILQLFFVPIDDAIFQPLNLNKKKIQILLIKTKKTQSSIDFTFTNLFLIKLTISS